MTDLLVFIFWCVVLVLSGTFLVKSLAGIARFFKVREFVVGFVIIALSTSLPELFVSISSSLKKNSSLALGTIIGSNILDLTIVIGIVALLGRGIEIKSKTIRKDSLYMLAIVALPILLMWDKQLSRLDGIILLVVFVYYMWRVITQGKEFRKTEAPQQKTSLYLNALLFVASLFLLLFSSNLVVEYGLKISYQLAVPIILVGLFAIALGTSLPELTFEARAVLMGHDELALGDVIGSVIINSTLCLGIAALIFPITTQFLFFISSASFMLIVALLFVAFVEAGRRITWKEGLALILLYIFFTVVELNLKGVIAVIG